MKRIISILIFSLAASPSFCQQMEEQIRLARQFIGFLENNQFYDAEDLFTVEVQNALTPEQLEKLWIDLIAHRGSFGEIVEVQAEDMGEYVVTRSRVNFSSAPIIIQLAFDKDKKISGIYFRPVVTEASYALPDYANPDLYIEEEMYLEVPQGQLPATFTYPAFIDKYPVVVLIHGSGPHDRDETIGPNKPFKDLAIGLATQGIATFRFEKKTKVYPDYYKEISSSMTIEDEILEDAASAIKAVRRIKGTDNSKIYILGHSLGGMLAPRITEENRPVDGLIIMAGNARPLEDLILYQVGYLSSLDNVPESQKQSLQQMREQVQKLKNMDLHSGVPPAQLPLGLPASYWIDLSAYDQLEVAEEINEPILILQGERDYQVPVQEYQIWQEALAEKDNVKFMSYPELNHLFMPGEGLSTPLEYQVPGHVHEQVIRDIADWIKHKK